MRTRSSSNLIVESSIIPKRRNRRRSTQIVEPELRTSVETPVATMADTRTMSELLQAPTEGYGDAIVIPPIFAENFELKVELLSLVTSSQFHGFERDDPHSHILWFNKITSMLKYKNVPHNAIKLMLFPFSLEGAARIWLEKEPPRSILSWEDLVSKFMNYFFPPSKTTNLKNNITNFQQKFDETFSEAWDRFKDLLPAGANLLKRTPRDALTIIKNKSKVRTSRNKLIVSKVSTTTSSSSPSPDCLAADGNTFNAYAAVGTYNQGGNGYRPQGDPNYRASNQMGPPGFPSPNVQNSQNYNQNRYNQNQGNYQAPNNQGRGQNFNQGNNNYQALNFQAPNYQAQVGPSNELTNYMKSNEATLRAMQTQMTNMKTELRNEFKSSLDTRTNKIENQNNQIMNMLTNLTMQKQNPSGSGSLPSNTVANPRGSTAHIQPLVVQVPIPEPDVALKSKPKPSIPYPSRLNDQKLREKANNQMLKFLQIFQRLHFDLSFADALLHMPKFASTFKSLLSNKEKLFELANTPLNENCSAVLLKKLPEKLGDPGKFLIPCDFPELVECLALADLGASINLMPLSVWKKLSLPELTPTRMTLELANRSIAYPVGVAEDVIVKVGKFHFLADFVVVDYDVDPRVPLILGRPFLRTARALIDVHGEELILRDGDEQLIFHADSTSKHPNKHSNESINMINFIDITCEDRFPEVLKLKKSNHPSSGNPTLSFDFVAEFPSPSPISYEDKKSSGSTTIHFDYSLLYYDAFYFDDDHIEEKSSDSTNTHSDFSLPEYDSFIFDLSIDPFPPVDRSVSHHEEFVDELAHILSSPEYDRFYFDLEADPGEFTSVLEKDLIDLSTKDFTSIELNNSLLLLYDYDSSLSKEFFEIDLQVSFPLENEDIVFDPRIIIIKGVQSQRFKVPLNFFLLSHSRVILSS
ncbi:reverse transcriptase domain-containing protein [Tanacetum coccineum]